MKKNAAFVILYRDIILYMRNSSEFFSIFLFFVMITSLFFFILSEETIFFKKIGVCVIWINVLLSMTLSLDSLFKLDYNYGISEQLILSPFSLSFLIFLKIIALWISIFFPMTILAPIIGLLFGLSFHEACILFFSLLLGTPTLTVIGIIGVTLTLVLYRGGVLLTILILPLYIPVLIFGVSSVLFFIDGGLPFGHFSILLSLLILVFLIGPFIISSSLRVSCYL